MSAGNFLLSHLAGSILSRFAMVEIIVADDSQEDLLLMERVIRQARLLNPVRLFREPLDLLGYFSSASEDGEPVLMFLDLIMIPWNGIDLLRSARSYPLAKRSIAVMLTGLGDVRHIQRAYAEGATTFLLKPISAHEINNFLRAFRKNFNLRDVPDGKYLEWTASPPRDVERCLDPRGEPTELIRNREPDRNDAVN